MRYPILTVVFSVSLIAQNQANCNDSIARDVDARCGCVRDPNSQLCEMVKKGFYDDHPFGTGKPLGLGWSGVSQPAATHPTARTPTPPRAQAARPQQARLVPLAHKDYLRFIQPNARLVAGFDFEKASQSPELMEALLGQSEGDDNRVKVAGALKEMDHLWLSFVPPDDVVILMTGKFEQGVTAGMFYAQGIRPVFLGSARVMLVGPEPAIQAALARLAKPAAAGGWVARRARELSRDHETWIVNEPPPGANGALQAIRQFSLGFRMTADAGIDGEAVADSEADAVKVAAWVVQMKSTTRGVLNSMNIKREGSTLRFEMKDDVLLTGDKSKTAMNSDVGVELYGLVMSGFPGMPARAVAEDKLLAVRMGMNREAVLSLLGPPLSVSAIYGLDTPRETWTYQIPFGKQLTMRLEGGVVASVPR